MKEPSALTVVVLPTSLLVDELVAALLAGLLPERAVDDEAAGAGVDVPLVLGESSLSRSLPWTAIISYAFQSKSLL